MFTSTVILAGTVVIQGEEFRWWVTDALALRLIVTHPVYGTEAQPLTAASPALQARTIGRAMLAKSAASIIDP